MAKIVKPDLTYQWASAAGGGSVAPNSTKIQTGHIVEKPNYEYMNWLQNRQDTSIAYTFQMGVPEWDSLVEYQYHANYKSYVQRNGLVYKALQVGTNKDPATEAAYWALAFDNYGSADTVQSNLTTHITNYGTLASLSNAATARTNLDVYSKGEGDARYAALGGLNSQLFLVANGTTGYEAVNFSQLATKAPVAGNSAQEFAVATATTGNSAVNKTQADSLIASAVSVPMASIIPSGGVIMWPTSVVPTGFLELNGQSTTGYPNLIAIYGATLPDMRGEFVRGWDHSRGVDSGRGVLTAQAATSIANLVASSVSLNFKNIDGTDGTETFDASSLSGNTDTRTFYKVRPRNIAWMFIVKT